MKSIKILITLLMMCFVTNILGQTKAPHTYKAFEIKKQAIENKALQKLGISLAEINKLRKDKSGESLYKAKENAKKSYIKKKGEIKLSFDVLIDEFSTKNDAINNYKDVIIKKICKDLTELERAKLCIEVSFKKWAEKGEYEKKEEYEARMANKYKMLEKISQNIILSFVNKEVILKTGKYNIDKEIYNISLMKRYPFYLFNTRNALLNEVYTYHNTIFKDLYPNDQADSEIQESYEKKTRNYSLQKDFLGEYVIKFPTYIKKIGRDIAKHYKTEEEIYSDEFWDGEAYVTTFDNCIVYEGYFLPNKIEIEGQLYETGLFDTYISDWTLNKEEVQIIAKMQKKANLKYPTVSELNFNTNELGLSKYFPENYTFKITNN